MTMNYIQGVQTRFAFFEIDTARSYKDIWNKLMRLSSSKMSEFWSQSISWRQLIVYKLSELKRSQNCQIKKDFFLQIFFFKFFFQIIFCWKWQFGEKIWKKFENKIFLCTSDLKAWPLVNNQLTSADGLRSKFGHFGST